MAGKFGVAELKKMAVTLAGVANAVSKLLHKDLFAVWNLVGAVSGLKDVDFAELKAELGELDVSERAEVEAVFKANLALVDPAAQAKVVAAVSALEDVISVISEVIAVVAKIKLVLGV